MSDDTTTATGATHVMCGGCRGTWSGYGVLGVPPHDCRTVKIARLEEMLEALTRRVVELETTLGQRKQE